MAVTETLRALGSWGISFKKTLPDDVWKRIEYFGHVAVHVGRKPGALEDSLLSSARYVGVLRSISDQDAAQRTVGGLGMAMWLGDPDGKADVFKDPLVLNGDFDDVIRAALPASGSVTEGTLFNIGETFTGTFQFQTPRDVIDYICQTVAGDVGWRVNGDGTLDAGRESDLFTVNPKCVVVRKKLGRTVSGFNDMFLEGLGGNAKTSRDVEDYTTDVLLLAQGVNGQFVAAEASTPTVEIPFKDVHGNTVKFVRIVQESETELTNADARAQLQLNRFKSTRDALELTSGNYDIKGSAEVGDYLWVFDPEMDLVDIDNEVMFRGQRINPFKLRLTETTWPITNKMSVFYRDGDGAWLDLTPYVQAETGDTTLVVGGYNRSLTEGGSGAFPVTPPEADNSIPDITVWDLPWQQAMYQSPQTGESRSEVELKWFRPDNTDATTITDGAYYEIRFRQSTTPLYPPTIDELAAYEVDELNTVEAPILLGIEQEWQYARAPFDTLKFRLMEMMPGMTYEAQIRAVDSARPPHLGEWSTLEVWQNSRDIFPPATPAAPFIASSPMAVLMRHNLGRADGGEFNLDRDLGHLELHYSEDPLFAPSAETLVGKVLANWGMISGQVPLVTSFQITSLVPMYYKVVAVDLSGNKSLPSAAVVATAELIDNQYVRNLTVDKVTAGTVSADWLIGARIATGFTGARVQLSSEGIQGYNPFNQQLLNWDSGTGQLDVMGDKGIRVTGGGNVEITDGAVVIKNSSGDVIVELGECSDGRHGLQVYKDNGTRVVRIGELASSSEEGIELINDIGQLVKLSDVIFGISSNTFDSLGNRPAGGGYGDCTGQVNQPITTATISNTGRALVIISALIVTPDGSLMSMGLRVTGPGGYSYVPSSWNSLGISALGGVSQLQASKMFIMEGLPTGVCTFTCRYSYSGSSGNGQAANRAIAVLPY